MTYIPVVTAQEMRKIEKLAIKEGGNEEVFMRQAGLQVGSYALEWIGRHSLPRRVTLLIGKGNKGGDAYAAGIYLLQNGIRVRALHIEPPHNCSPLNQLLSTEFVRAQGHLELITPEVPLEFEGEGLIIDGFLGTGFQGEVQFPLSMAIGAANISGVPILAIDIPSGLDATTGEVKGIAIQATETITLGMFKSGLVLRDGWNYTGRIQCKNFGLAPQYFSQVEAIAHIPTKKTLASYLPPIVRNRHKYQAGYVVGFSGSKIFKGAPKIAGLASLRSGAGIVRIFHKEEIGPSPDPLICQLWNKKEWEEEKKRAGALFLGPGCGDKIAFLRKEIPLIQNPLVVDADAIQKEISYPKQTILTPHRGEVLRLLGLKKTPSEEDLLALCHKWAHRTQCILVLKGAPTWIFSKNSPPVLIPHGDPGMAKAGMGDALTGIIAALLAQKATPLHAAILGVSLHAIAGEKGALQKSSYSLLPGDLIECLPQAIMEHGARMVRFIPFHKTDNSFF